jgi:hypothetical protein
VTIHWKIIIIKMNLHRSNNSLSQPEEDNEVTLETNFDAARATIGMNEATITNVNRRELELGANSERNRFTSTTASATQLQSNAAQVDPIEVAVDAVVKAAQRLSLIELDSSLRLSQALSVEEMSSEEEGEEVSDRSNRRSEMLDTFSGNRSLGLALKRWHLW